MPAGNPLGYLQGGGIDPQLMQFLTQLLQQAPNKPAGGATDVMPPTAVPSNMRVPTEQESLMGMLLQRLQQPQAGVHAMNAPQGMMGGAFGSMGGRPRNS
jgi:hypothetical protein